MNLLALLRFSAFFSSCFLFSLIILQEWQTDFVQSTYNCKSLQDFVLSRFHQNIRSSQLMRLALAYCGRRHRIRLQKPCRCSCSWSVQLAFALLSSLHQVLLCLLCFVEGRIKYLFFLPSSRSAFLGLKRVEDAVSLLIALQHRLGECAFGRNVRWGESPCDPSLSHQWHHASCFELFHRLPRSSANLERNANGMPVSHAKAERDSARAKRANE